MYSCKFGTSAVSVFEVIPREENTAGINVGVVCVSLFLSISPSKKLKKKANEREIKLEMKRQNQTKLMCHVDKRLCGNEQEVKRGRHRNRVLNVPLSCRGLLFW